jgi:photosystem II stability/assembly factor-like uncharacterized protein
VQTNGPNVSSILSLAGNSNNIFAATTLGLYHSTNNGSSWVKANIGIPPNTSVNTVNVNGIYIYAGTYNGLFVSTDNGTNWTQKINGLPTYVNVYSFTFIGDNIFAGIDGGVYLSIDNGTSWTPVGLNGLTIESLASMGNNLYAVAYADGVYLSTNNGARWTKVNNNLPYYADVNFVAVNGNNIFAATVVGLYISTDNGTKWTRESPVNFPIFSFAANGSNIFVSTYNELYYSSNNCLSWTLINGGLYGNMVRALLAIDTVIFAGTQNGMNLSTNNGTIWKPVNNGLTNANITAITCSGSNIIANSASYGFFISSDNGNTWKQVYSGGGDPFYINGMNTFALGGGGVILSTDNGMNWGLANNGLPSSSFVAMAGNGSTIVASAAHYHGGPPGGIYITFDNAMNWTQLSDYGDWINILVFCGNNLFAGTGGIYSSPGGVLRSNNNGSGWVSAGLENQYISTLASRGINLFASSDSGVFLSSDNGTNWTSINNGLNNNHVYSFSFVGDNIFAAGGFSVFLSTNNGTNWTDVGNNLPETYILSLTTDGNSIYAGTYGDGVWKRPLSEIVPVELTSFTVNTKKNTANLRWRTVTETNNRGFEIQRKTSIHDFITVAFVKGNGTSTKTNDYSWSDKLQPGIYSYRLKQIDYNGKFEYSKEVEVTIIPNVFSLEQNFPNPFNPNTVISYSIPSSSNVKLKVYNELGQTVKILEHGYKNAGNYSVNFNAHDLPSGIYFYRLEAGEFMQVRKMMLVK